MSWVVNALRGCAQLARILLDAVGRRSALFGTACDTKTAHLWKKNAGGLIRQESEVCDVARALGVDVPDDVLFWSDPDLFKRKPPTYASYGGFVSTAERIEWAQFYGTKGKIPVRIRPDVLESDIAILAIVAHEVYELNALRKLFEERETMSGAELARLISVTREKNLHWLAWEDADRRVLAQEQPYGS
jgi:hypothetical protein